MCRRSVKREASIKQALLDTWRKAFSAQDTKAAEQITKREHKDTD